MSDISPEPALASQGARRPAKATRASRLAGALRDEILRGRLAPGAKVNLEHLRDAYDVSLSPLREAVSRLVADGLVEVEDQRGYRIAPVSPENLAEVTRLRAELESLALSAAVAQADLDWESGILAALHRLGRAVRDPSRPGTMDEWEAAHEAFHAALIAGCRMPILLRFAQSLQILSARYRHLSPPAAAGPGDPDGEHAAIAEAAVARDAARAADLLRAHIERAGGRLAARMRQAPGGGTA